MPRLPTLDELLFAPLPPSALARGERAVGVADVRELADGRAAAEALARAVPGEAAPSGLRARIAASAAGGGKYGRFADRLARLFDLDLEEAKRVLVRAEDPASFKPGPVPNTTWMFVKPGPRFAGGMAAIGRLAPGAFVPDHGHGSDETTLVLEGGFAEEGEGGQEVWRGDELYKGPGSVHAFRVVGDGPCVAAVIAPKGVVFG
jgi:quercetin dioxygenase-like cupin family protein